MAQPQRQDRRTGKTQQAVQSAFVGLVFERRYEDIRVADIIDRANVGRSTFYEHYRGKEDVLERTFAGLLAILADAACGVDDDARLAFAVSHFWDNRRLARTIFGPPLDALPRKWLGEMILDRLPAAADPVPVRIRAIQLAAAQLALLEAWLTGRLAASQPQIVRALAVPMPLLATPVNALGDGVSASARG